MDRQNWKSSNAGSPRQLIVIGGATATGKTSMAIRLALHYGTEIISADSRQIYREMNIGTAKPDPKELAEVSHHFVGHLSVTQPYSAGEFSREATSLMEKLFHQYDKLICTGGTGFYIKALCQGLDEFPDVDKKVEEDLIRLLETEGIESLQQRLKEGDPDYYASADVSNPRRLIRALSVMEATNQPFSSFLGRQKQERPYNCLYIQLDMETELLYRRINERVDQMMQNGLLNEVQSLLPHRHLRALDTVGYRELFRHLDGELSEKEAVDLIKRNSRRYAKRQKTWFRNQGQWRVFHPEDVEGIIEYIDNYSAVTGI